MLVFDAHCDTICRAYRLGTSILRENPGGHWDIKRAKTFQSCAQIFALYEDSKGKCAEDLAEIYHAQQSLFFADLARNRADITLCRTGNELRAAWQSGRIAAFLSVEGAELIGCTLEGLERAYALGVRAINLTWNRANALSGSVVEERTRGLSDLGRAFVLRMQALGMLVDVSHLSDPGFWDVLHLAQKPVIASHSNARALCPHPRNLTNAQLSALIQNGGVVGLNLYADFVGEQPNFDSLRAHLDHFLSLGGERHVALGGDWDGCDRLPQGFEAGLSALADFYDYLLQKHYSEALLEQITFKNLVRVVDELCTM